jgi:hypothetical protein
MGKLWSWAWRSVLGPIWRDGHEQGWNDCLHKWECHEKMRAEHTNKLPDSDQLELPFQGDL